MHHASSKYAAYVWDSKFHPLLQECRYNSICFRRFNGLNLPSAHLIFDWLFTRLARFQFPLFIMRLHMPRFSWPCPSSYESSISSESGKWTLINSFSVPLPVWVTWPLGSLIVLTLFCCVFYHDLLAVPPPRGSFGFSYFFVITGKGFLVGIPLSCSFRYNE
jgi:hypothetical protein